MASTYSQTTSVNSPDANNVCSISFPLIDCVGKSSQTQACPSQGRSLRCVTVKNPFALIIVKVPPLISAWNTVCFRIAVSLHLSGHSLPGISSGAPLPTSYPHHSPIRKIRLLARRETLKRSSVSLFPSSRTRENVRPSPKAPHPDRNCLRTAKNPSTSRRIFPYALLFSDIRPAVRTAAQSRYLHCNYRSLKSPWSPPEPRRGRYISLPPAAFLCQYNTPA